MTRLFVAFALAAGLGATTPSPPAAAELAERYEAMGTMTVELGDETLDLVVPYDIETARAFAERRMIMGDFLTINVLGRTVAEDGTPGRPMAQVTMQERGDGMHLLSAEVFDARGYDSPLVMGADGGEGEIADFSLDGDALTATVEGTFLRVTDYADDPQVADEPQAVAARVEVSVDLPPMTD
jgi:hypothetical protein